MPDLEGDGWEERKGEGEEEEAGGGRGVGGLTGTIKNTARTIPFFFFCFTLTLFPSSSSYRFSHPLFSLFFI